MVSKKVTITKYLNRTVLIIYGMNECLPTPQHTIYIGYWVSNKGICEKLYILKKFKWLKKRSLK